MDGNSPSFSQHVRPPQTPELDAEAAKITQRFRAFAATADLGRLGDAKMVNYRLPMKVLKPLSTFGKLYRLDKQWYRVADHYDGEPPATVFEAVGRVVNLHCTKRGLWAEDRADDTADQSALRQEWLSVRRDWKQLAHQYQIQMPDGGYRGMDSDVAR